MADLPAAVEGVPPNRVSFGSAAVASIMKSRKHSDLPKPRLSGWLQALEEYLQQHTATASPAPRRKRKGVNRRGSQSSDDGGAAAAAAMPAAADFLGAGSLVAANGLPSATATTTFPGPALAPPGVHDERRPATTSSACTRSSGRVGSNASSACSARTASGSARHSGGASGSSWGTSAAARHPCSARSSSHSRVPCSGSRRSTSALAQAGPTHRGCGTGSAHRRGSCTVSAARRAASSRHGPRP